MGRATSFGEWLTLWRRSLHLQRTELAGRIGCAAVTLRKIEADERRPSREFAERLADELGISPQDRETFIRVARAELPVSRLPAIESSPAGPSNLPSPTTSLIGRERDIEEVEGMLGRPDVRLLTLTGAPGVGKTRLALEAASRGRGLFTDGTFFISLASLDEAQVLVAMAHALRLGPSGRQPLPEHLANYLRARQVLLVLDNFEHVLSVAPQLTRLLVAAPEIKLLVTSRTVLRLAGEHRFVVTPLPVPAGSGPGRRTLAAGGAGGGSTAVDLFMERARVAEPGLSLSEANLRAIDEICRRLDGLPLAIELVAARVTLFTPQELLARLDSRLALLAGGPRDAPARHLTLERALEWSYRLLAPSDQQMFCRLSVFAGGFTLEAAQAVCLGADTAHDDAADRLLELVASSLVQRRADADGHSRFDMLLTVREYAARQLAASSEAAGVRQRHAAHFLRLAEAAEQAWDTPTERNRLRELVAERENLRAALRWGLDTSDAAFLLRLNAALFSFWTTCSALAEARQWLEAALALAGHDEAPERAGDLAKVLNVAGYVAAAMGEHAQATASFERGLALYRELGDARGLAWSIRGCAFARMLGDEVRAAERLLAQSLRICIENGDAWGRAWSYYALAFLRLAAGDLERARPALEEALLHLRQQRIPFGLFRALLALGHAVFVEGDIARAEALYREGLQLTRDTPVLTFITIGLDGLAAVAATRGQALRAARLWGAAEALREATDEQRWPVFERTYDRALAGARAQVSPIDWTTAWDAGRGLTPEHAVTEALGHVAPSPGSGTHTC
jgi:predicted ATPase/DNA-binding XRE family transcriptional regulator